VAEQWEKGVVLRLGRFIGLKGPGLFWIIPLVDRVAFWIDLRVRTTGFAAEKTLTMDTVPINVDAVLFWIVTDARRAALEVADYQEAEREKQARVILGDAEVEIADKFERASERYQKNPIAFQLRAMNILYEGVKERGSLMVVPSPMVQSMSDFGGYAGLASLAGMKPQPPKEE
jgi:regulator of protease activity HflC (stomatin/prohibitin superfamily)